MALRSFTPGRSSRNQTSFLALVPRRESVVVAIWICALALGVAVLGDVLAVLGEPTDLGLLLFPLIFPMQFWCIRIGLGLGLDTRNRLRRDLPAATRYGVGALILAAWVGGMVAMLHLSGHPAVIDGRHVLWDDGRAIPQTAAQVAQRSTDEHSVFTMLPTVFLGIHLLMNLAARAVLDDPVRMAPIRAAQAQRADGHATFVKRPGS